ncbi:hypothetical protein [Falsirhodobacter algicola]|uniref:Tetratricopeptide repeat-like domain-containing protein n=1 Tax=Falsirhodobacter algicola TaxID=2692330 RepID=A0A8J8SK31_9RHOB|nr:hypothetical protein [Falsirhodobacter algicola]QUS35455.1 hypothetical protein GR316_03730 [Falsirhodobacter algicola]
MSNSDNFINEVADELRREKLFNAAKRFGWIAVLAVVAIAGGVAWTEWQDRTDTAEARALGDTLFAALDADDPATRRSALDAVDASGERGALVGLMQASDPEQDKAATLAALDRVIGMDGLSPQFHDLAVLRKVVVAGGDLSVEERRALLRPISGPGQPYRPLALELLAYLDLEGGDRDAAIEGLRALLTDQQAPQDLRQRVAQVITALGGSTTEAG